MRSRFSNWKKLSATALSWQLPRRLMLLFKLWAVIKCWHLSLVYWEPCSEWISTSAVGLHRHTAIPITGGNSGDASSTTHATVSDGTITIRNTDKQQQNVTELSRDAEHANNALSPIFDKEKEQNHLREINLIGEIGNQVGDIARTQGLITMKSGLIVMNALNYKVNF